MNEKCNKIVMCYDNTPRPCKRDKGHEYGCNPFSNDYPILAETVIAVELRPE